MSKYPQINFDLNLIFLGFNDKATAFIKQLTSLPHDTSYIAKRNNTPIEIHLNKWLGEDTSFIYREMFEEIPYGDIKIIAAYIELERLGTKTEMFKWYKHKDITNKSSNSRLTIDSSMGIYCIKEKHKKKK